MPLPNGGTGSRPIGLNFGSIMTVGSARGVDIALLAEVLPTVEQAVITALNGDIEEG